ncbi:MAG: hypothetical protein HZA36_03090 [Parcubacteria group bacterium]|nr:hypothetical protein [Parcubacteria group bacterium]
MRIKLLHYVAFSCMLAGMLFVASPAPADAFYLRVPETLKRVLLHYRANLAQISSTSTTCPSDQWWDSSTNSCKSSTTTTTTNTACPSGQYWNGTNCVSSTTNTCPSGQWWDSSTNSCKSSTTTTGSCPSGEYWYTPPGGGAGYCQSQSAACTQAGGTWNSSSNYCQMPTCSSGQWWDSSTKTCKSSTATVGSCSSSEWWDAATSTCKPSSATGTCSSGQWWYTSPSGGAGYCRDSSTACTQAGGTWNSSSNYCQMPTCPSGQYWYTPPSGGTGYCTSSTSNTCPSGQYWYTPPSGGAGYCTSSTAYAGDANSCPGFSYSRWDQGGKRYCQLNNERKCDYNYPSYLTNGTNYKVESCPAETTPQACPAGQYWYSPPGGGAGSCTSTVNSTCDASLKQLLGDGCHQMSTDSSGRALYCDGSMTKSAKQGDTTTTPGCSPSNTQQCSSGQYWYVPSGGGAGYCKASDQQANQREQVWNSLGLRSWVRNDADPVRVENLKQACANTPSGANVWMPDAGSAPSVNFGMPDPEKCRTYSQQSQCPAGQQWVSQGGTAGYCKVAEVKQCSQGQSWDPASQSCRVYQGQCPDGQLWVSQGGTAGYCQAKQQQCSSEQHWDQQRNACVMNDRQQQEGDFSRIKQGARFLESGVKRSERDLQRLEKNGITISSEMKASLERLKKILSAAKSAKSFDEFEKLLPEGADISNLEQDVRELEQYIRETQQEAQQLIEMRRGVKRLEQDVKTFEKKVNTLVKRNTKIPQELLDTLSKIKALIEVIKNAKTWDELDKAGIDDLPEFFSSLNQYRSELELISRWPDVSRQVSRELVDIERNLVKAKNMVARLAKKNIDVSHLYADLEGGATSLRASKGEAEELVGKGEAREAMSVLEQKFYDQANDFRQIYQVLLMVNNNFGGFTSEFKKMTDEMTTRIRALQRNKIDVGELQDLLGQIKTSGSEILAELKNGVKDPEAVTTNIQELWAMRDEFLSIVRQYSGETERKPWEVGPGFFGGTPQLPSGWGQFFEGNDSGMRTAPPPPQPMPVAPQPAMPTTTAF